MQKHKLFKSNGFTAAEVLIMIVVIGILASISYANYAGYWRNATKAQISSAANAYQSSIKSYVFENEKYPTSDNFCLPYGSKCCIHPVPVASAVKCGTDSEHGWAPGSVVTEVSKYVSGNAPLPPVVSTFPDCPNSYLNGGPCKTSRFTYIPKGNNQYDSTDADVKAFLLYYIDPTYDCGSNDVMSFSGSGSNMVPLGDTHTTRTSSYTECVIALR